MEYAKLCMSMRLGNVRYSAESGVRRCRVRASALSGWCPSQEQCFAIRSAEVDRGRLGRRQPGSLLTEDLVHDLSAPSKGRHDLVPVDQLGCGRLVVVGKQRY
jgi:hypothetical protein